MKYYLNIVETEQRDCPSVGELIHSIDSVSGMDRANSLEWRMLVASGVCTFDSSPDNEWSKIGRFNDGLILTPNNLEQFEEADGNGLMECIVVAYETERMKNGFKKGVNEADCTVKLDLLDGIDWTITSEIEEIVKFLADKFSQCNPRFVNPYMS